MRYESTGELFEAVQRKLASWSYPRRCKDEQEFERAVWNHLRAFIKKAVGDPAQLCLTSHTWSEGRSASAFRAFCAEERGADVKVLRSKNRLDIVLRHPDGGSIGVEVKCLGTKGHARKLTQGIGQAMLALAHRDHTILAIHCGTVEASERDQLRAIAIAISAPPRMAIVVVP